MRMPRFSLLTAFSLFLAFTIPAEASFAPVKFKSTRERIAQVCDDLGPRASLTAWHYEADQYGCVDTETGNVLICESDGNCTLYFGSRLVLATLTLQV